MVEPEGAPTAPVPPARRRVGASVIWLGLLITLCAAATIGVVLYFGSRFGPVAVTVGIVGAVLPVPFLVWAFLWLDRYRPPPAWLVVVCFLWGAGAATAIALVLNTVAADHFGFDIAATVVGPAIEETLKALLPLLLFVFYRRAFTGIIDAVVYCGLSAIGLAMVENILYLGLPFARATSADAGYSLGALLSYDTFLARVPLSGFAHPLFTSLTGIGIGIAARSPRRAVRVLAPLLGLLLAMTLHGTWNAMEVLTVTHPFARLYGYFAFFVPLFFFVMGTLLFVRSREGRLAERVLPPYVAYGWFSPPEVIALGTMGRRLSARRWAQRVAGEPGQSAMKVYQHAATRLAILRDGLDRGLYRKPRDIDRVVAEERHLLQTIDGQRRVFAGRDPWTPWAWWDGVSYHIQFPDGQVRRVPPPPLPVVPLPLALPQPPPGPLPLRAYVPPPTPYA